MNELKKPIFILGSGRSGTTLLQRILNSYSEIIIWGEHDSILTDIASAYFNLKNSSSMNQFSYDRRSKNEAICLDKLKDPNSWQAWNNWFFPEDLPAMFRNVIESIFVPNVNNFPQIWGFKEIRYKDEHVIKFLNQLYPEGTFIFIVRDGLNVIESQLTTFHKGNSSHLYLKRLLLLPKLIKIALDWAKTNRYYLELSRRQENCFLIKYEDLIADINTLNPILDKYNLKLGKQQNKILQLKGGRGSSFSTSSQQTQRWLRLGKIPLLIAEVIIGKTCNDLSYNRPERLQNANKISCKIAWAKNIKNGKEKSNA